MVKKLLISLTLTLFIGFTSVAQDYLNDKINAIDIIEVIDDLDFEAQYQLREYEIDLIKTVILQLNDSEILQVNIDGWSYCTNKREEAFRIWNLNYKKVTESYFNKNCKQLVYLMIFDGAIRTR